MIKIEDIRDNFLMDKKKIDDVRKKRIIYCNICKSRFHSGKTCNKPSMSYGVILFRINTKDRVQFSEIKKRIDGSSNILPTLNYSVEYLLINRKHSINFIDFSRGIYKASKNNLGIKVDEERLWSIFSNMTVEEKKLISIAKSFEEIWCYIWGSMCENGQIKFDKKKHKIEFKKAKFKYGILLESGITKYINDTPSIELEWGFPKGRKNIGESNIACAKREFQEETGLESSNYSILKNIIPERECFNGSDNKKYNYVYYIGIATDNNIEVKVNDSNKLQSNEIGRVEWCSYNSSIEKLKKNNNPDRLRILHTINYLIETRLS